MATHHALSAAGYYGKAHAHVADEATPQTPHSERYKVRNIFVSMIVGCTLR